MRHLLISKARHATNDCKNHPVLLRCTDPKYSALYHTTPFCLLAPKQRGRQRLSVSLIRTMDTVKTNASPPPLFVEQILLPYDEILVYK